jgi:hypothetical protein
MRLVREALVVELQRVSQVRLRQVQVRLRLARALRVRRAQRRLLVRLPRQERAAPRA